MKKILILFLSLILIVGIGSANLPNSSVKLLLEMNGTFEDLSASGHTITNSGAFFNTTTPLRGNASMFSENASLQYIYADGSSDFTFNGNDFSIEGFANLTGVATTTMTIYDQRPVGINGNYTTIRVSTARKLVLLVNATQVIIGASTIPLNTPFHWKLVRYRNTTQLMYNGNIEGTVSGDNTYYINGVSRPIIGNAGSGPSTANQFPGMIDDVVVKVGLGVSNSTTVPDTEFISNPKASFTQNVTTCLSPCAVLLTNKSVGNVNITHTQFWATKSALYGGNDTPILISDNLASTSPTLDGGNWTINLTAWNDMGISYAYGWVNVTPTLVSSFTPSGTTNTWYPNSTLFTDTSTGSPTGWNWTARNVTGNNVTYSFSTNQNSTFIPQTSGNFSIQLNATKGSEFSLSTQITFVNVSQAAFTANATNGYQYPMPVQFTDTSTGVPTNWSWSFGDTYTSTQQNPLHIYTVAGNYTVSLTAWNATSGFSTSAPGYIQLWTDDDTYLRSWLQFENATITDLKGVAWTNSGCTLTSPGRFLNQSLNVPTGNNYIASASSPIWGRSALSGELEMWINVSSYGDAGKTYFRRSSGTSGTSNGWGFFNINGTRYGNAFYYGSGANYTTPFDLPPNTWVHVALVRDTAQYWNVYVNGVRWGTPVYMGSLNVDTANPVYIGSSGPGTEPAFRIDEFRYSQAVPRFVSNFSTPYAAYRGSLTGGIDPNPNSTYRYKTNPDSVALIYNQSFNGLRNRTVQVQNISEARYLIGGGNFDAAHERVQRVILNKTNYPDLVLESSSVDNVAGTVSYNVSRGGTNLITALFDNRTNFLDVEVLYWNYTENTNDFQYFAYGTLIDGGAYPVHNFIATPITYGMWGKPVVDFSANTTTPNILSTVQFTDASTNYPDSYLWDFGDGTTSTLKNPTHVYTALGTYDVTETAYLGANVSITNTTTKAAYITVLSSAGVPAANFVGTPLVTNIGSPVAFTDTSTGSPTSWTWDFGDSSGSATQNPTHAYSSLGLYTVNLTVSNLNGTTTLSRASYINVTNTTMTGFNPVDILMNPSYVLTLHVTDSDTGQAIPDVTLLDSNGDTFTTTNGTFYLTYDYGAVVLYLTSSGYVSKSVSYVIDSDQTQTVQMVPVDTTISNSNTVYTQHFISFRVVDLYNRPIYPVTVTSFYRNSSLPAGSDVMFLTRAFGVNSEVALAMLNSSAAMTGITGNDGKVGFVMFPAIQYTVQAVNASLGAACQMTVYPTDSDYLIYCPTQSQSVAYNNTATQIAGSYTWITEPNKSFVTFNSQYQDPYGLTNDLWFNVTCADNRSLMYSQHWTSPGTALKLANFTLPNVRGTQINAYLKYNRSGS